MLAALWAAFFRIGLTNSSIYGNICRHLSFSADQTTVRTVSSHAVVCKTCKDQLKIFTKSTKCVFMNVKVFVFPFLCIFHPMEFYKAWDEAERERKRSREPEESSMEYAA